MRRGFLLVAGFVLMFAGLVPAAGADSSARPFKGSMNGEVTFVPDGGCPIGIRTLSDATGEASHLGNSVLSSGHCTPTGDQISGGMMTLVAANGDEVNVAYTGTAPFPAPGTEIIVADIDFEILGGTGRFEGATGRGDMTGYIVFAGFGEPVWPASWVWTGTIGY